MTQVTLIASKDHPLGGFRLWRKGDLFYAAIMDDPDTLTDNPQWDLQNWIDGLPLDNELEALTFSRAEDLYPTYYRMSQEHHGAWNVCNFLQEFLPRYAGMGDTPDDDDREAA